MRYIKVYDKETRELIDKTEYDKRKAERAKPWHGFLPQVLERGMWRYDRVTRSFIKITERERKTLDAPAVHGDEIEPTISHATDEGKVFTSKKKLLEHYKQHGFACTWGERIKPKEGPLYKADRAQIREDAAKALNDLRWGNVPLSELEKELCLREQRAMRDYKRRMGGR